MIRERRQTTVPVAYQIPLICYPRKRKKAKKKILPQEGGYQSIPFPLKFAYTCGIYSFYGGITLKEHNGTLVTETPLLSQFLRCKEVQVRKEDNHKIISIAIQKNPAMQMPPWQHMVERLKESESHDLQSWGDLINEYCLKYEDKLRSLSNQESAKSPYSEDYLINMNKESEDKTNEIFRTYPTINFKATLEDNNMHLSEIVFNDKYLQGLGYSIDTFAVTTLRDGLPQLMPADNTYAVKMLLKNYYSLEKGGCQTPDLTSELILKKGYTRKVNYKVHYFATYKDGIFGVDCVLMITNREATAPPKTMFAPEFPLERDFIKEAVQKEQEAAIFLKKYYNTAPTLDYTNMDKICKVKYLGNPHNMPN